MPWCLGASWALVALIPLGAACAWPSPERQFLIEFFQACRVYDTTVLARLATVPCDPRTDGVVQSFAIVKIERANGGADLARRVTIRARVRSWEGELSERAMTLDLERRDGQWKVTSLTPPRASQTSPAASSAPPR
ncbi:MAG: hypothetical protein A3I61_11870 [Acidobacteria bacterium RIFCSPLOWO2_02_FULL_68_18]|nr:MAG: hypothetical protein A3I61_11870 [Acidobacteria bacterium RIFCSPLOWO2_02_FULL_68_18]OFW49652.1 MAG: hypothetical protein A3G77_16435 [Acidobacteria bacterium RIFCSPLOWO2_12_FULL_68_19]